MKSKNFTVLRVALLFFMLLLFGAGGIAQPFAGNNVLKICDGGDEGTDPDRACSLESIEATFPLCTSGGYVQLYCYAVDLEVGGNNPIIGNSYGWPENSNGVPLPPLHLRYEYSPGVYLYTDQVVSWKYLKDIYSDEGNLYKYFAGQVKVYSEILENTVCSEEPELSYFPMNVQLVTPSGKNYTAYPVYMFGADYDIFSCEIFEETEPLCVDPEHIIPVPNYDLDICVDCENCGTIIVEDPGEGNSQGRLSQIGNTAESAFLMVQNPFRESIDFEYDALTKGMTVVRIYNSNGHEVISRELSVIEGRNVLSIPAENLISGIYYIEIRQRKQSHVEKIVKL